MFRGGLTLIRCKHYFTFIQQNLSQITSGNTIQVMREAEQRYLEIMQGVVDSIRNEWSNKLAKEERVYEQRLQEVARG